MNVSNDKKKSLFTESPSPNWKVRTVFDTSLQVLVARAPHTSVAMRFPTSSELLMKVRRS